MAELVSLLREANEGLDEMIQTLDEQADQVFVGANSSEFVQVSLGPAGQLVAVTFHQQWLTHREAAKINERLAQALADAHRKVGERSAAALSQTTRFSEIAALLSDPQRLIERLGN